METYEIPLADASKFAYAKLSLNTKKRCWSKRKIQRNFFLFTRKNDPCMVYECEPNDDQCLGNKVKIESFQLWSWYRRPLRTTFKDVRAAMWFSFEGSHSNWPHASTSQAMKLKLWDLLKKVPTDFFHFQKYPRIIPSYSYRPFQKRKFLFFSKKFTAQTRRR